MVIPRVLAKVTGNLHQSHCRAGGPGRMGGSGQVPAGWGSPLHSWDPLAASGGADGPSTGQSEGFTWG